MADKAFQTDAFQNDSFQILITQAFTAALTFVGTVKKTGNHSFTGALTFSGALSKIAAKSFTATLSFSGTLNKTANHSFTAALTFTGSLTSILFQYVKFRTHSMIALIPRVGSARNARPRTGGTKN